MALGNTETTITVEPFDPNVDNAYDIARMHLAIRRWQESTGQNNFTQIYDSQPDLRALEAYYIEPGGNFFVARDNTVSRIVGFIGLKNEGEGLGRIRRLAVEPPYHRQGIGRMLVGTAVGDAISKDFTDLTLHTAYDENAKPLYEEFGFEATDFDTEHWDWVMDMEL